MIISHLDNDERVSVVVKEGKIEYTRWLVNSKDEGINKILDHINLCSTNKKVNKVKEYKIYKYVYKGYGDKAFQGNWNTSILFNIKNTKEGWK